ELPSVCEHIHLPLQSGSDQVLSAMRRGYTRDEYLSKVRSLRERCPGVAITADIIVGFPGETEEDFAQTCSALEEIRYDQIFSFKYSCRPGTVAARMTGMVEEKVKARRLAEIHAIQDRITEDYHRSAEGTVEEVLVEGRRDAPGQPFGRTRTNKIVNLEASDPARAGDLVRVRITKGLKHSLLGERET
ncbi:MAG: radical SAM protein, partial [Desulfomonile sp.]|nr:radical SAM protein [Desulfomonile sp.]